MCGLAGFWNFGTKRVKAETLQKVVDEMALALASRGPDDAGNWVHADSGIALAHRRLSILDLSPAGHQPMHSLSGRFTIAFNGEIYNHLAIRTELKLCGASQTWRGHSDTETLLAAFEYWGIENTLHRCEGMFAIALWDSKQRTLYLARDRLGQKPLYYGWSGREDYSSLIFASELKAFRSYPDFKPIVSRSALSNYLRFTYVPAPFSIYERIFKLESGCLLTITGRPVDQFTTCPPITGKPYKNMELRRWWALKETVISSRTKPFLDTATAIEALNSTLSKAVQEQSIADVPLGAFLSGGVDSSTIVALMQNQSACPINTFTIGFDEYNFDESAYARAVADHLGTNHHEMRVSSNMAQDVIPSLPSMYDEPFADSSQIPTHLVCREARRYVAVALSGDGGDELFGGYSRYSWGPRLWNRLSWMPLSFRQTIGDGIGAISTETWSRLGRLIGVPRLGERSHKLGNRLKSVGNMRDLYWSLVSEWEASTVLKDVANFHPSQWESNDALPDGIDAVEHMMFCDAATYLPDDILCKVDRAAMSCGLETRMPFLDSRVVDLAWRLPMTMKIRGNTSKWALRQVLYNYVPKNLIDRPKTGFGIPIGKWLRGPLREWADCLLDESRLRQEGYFHPKPIRELWGEHLTGKRDYTPKLWTILMFQAWLEGEKDRPQRYSATFPENLLDIGIHKDKK
jgi:asparagine synthase (glutamine-hydrolysing)